MTSRLYNTEYLAKRYSGWHIGVVLIHLNCARNQRTSLLIIVPQCCGLEQFWDGAGGILQDYDKMLEGGE